MTANPKRPTAALNMKKLRKLGKFIEKIREIILMMTNNILIFPTPTPALTSVTTHVNDLEAAEAIAKTRVAGSVAQRDIKYAIVLEDVHGLQAYVQILADAASNEEGAIMIITASGFDLKMHGVREKPEISVKYGKLSGSVVVIAKAVKGSKSNEWEISDNGTVWTGLPSTTKSRTTVTGLTPGALKYFRHRPVTKAGEGNWTQTVSILII